MTPTAGRIAVDARIAFVHREAVGVLSIEKSKEVADFGSRGGRVEGRGVGGGRERDATLPPHSTRCYRDVI